MFAFSFVLAVKIQTNPNHLEEKMSYSQVATSEVSTAVGAAREAPALADHLVGLPGSKEWALWRWVAVRGAGFPAALVNKLSQRECAEAADRVFGAAEEEERLRGVALELVNHALDELRATSAWDDKAKRGPLTKALRSLKANKRPEPQKHTGAVRAALDALQTAGATISEATSVFRKTYDEATSRTSQAIRDLLDSDRLCEAIIWQNRRAFHSGIDSLRRTTSAATSHGFKQRQNEHLVASYVQRYSVKNDTIGFFGPVGWARLFDSGAPVEVRPGTNLLAKRTVYFESWCVDQLAELFSRDPRFKRWATPCLLPYYFIENSTLYRSSQPPVPLFAKLAAVLSACDGLRPAYQIAAEIVETPYLNVTSENEVYKLLDYAVKEGFIVWAFECQVGPRAEENLRAQLERIDDESLRTEALAVLTGMENGREAVARAAGDASALDRALGELEERFSHLCGLAPTREAGATYAGRTLVYEDCRRDLEMNIGPAVIRELDSPLRLILTSARWFTFEVAKIYRRIFQNAYDELASLSGSAVVDGVAFWRRIHPTLSDEKKPLVRACTSEMQRRWEQVFALDLTRSRVAFRSQDLQAAVDAAFGVPRPGWGLARYHSPDLMISAESIEQIRRGDFQLVLGELHLGFNTLASVTFFEQHPAQEELIRATELDISEPSVIPIPPRYMPGITTRTTQTLITDKDYRFAFSPDACLQRPARTLLLGSLVIEQQDDGLKVRTRDGSLCLDLLNLFGGILAVLTADCFSLMPRVRHRPRVTIDRLVVLRETWCFGAEELVWTRAITEAERFLGARGWARRWKLPARVFVKLKGERKPVYVNMESPILVEMLARAVRRAGSNGAYEGEEVEVTEMLPGVEEAWLTDAAGERYTSELRLVAVDLAS